VTLIKRKVVRTSQPQQAVGVDWRNPISRGLLRALLPVGRQMRDVMGGAVTQVGCVPTMVRGLRLITNNGESLSAATSASNYVSMPVLSTGPVTSLFGGVRFSTPGASRPSLMFSSGVSSGVGGFEADAGNSFGDSNLAYFYQNNGTGTNPLAYANGRALVGTNPTNLTISNGVPFVFLGSFSQSTAGPSNRLFVIGNAALNDSIFAHDIGAFVFLQWARQLSDGESRSVTANPWQLFAPLERSIWVPVSAGGADITISGTVGAATAAGITGTVGLASNITISGVVAAATAAGTTGTVGVSIPITGNVGAAAAAGTTGVVGVSMRVAGVVGAATAAGTTGTVGVAIRVAGSVGAATAAGSTATVGVSQRVAGTVGAATAAGITAQVSVGSDVNITATPGAAVAAGTAGQVGVAQTIAGTVGAATAAGVTATVGLGAAITISGNVGAAAAAGITGTLQLEIRVPGVVAAAVAAGVTGSAAVVGAPTLSAPPMGHGPRLASRGRHAPASRGSNLSTRTR
jgi:hypothetical protein